MFIYLDVPRRYPNVENDAFVVPLLNFVWRIVFPFLNLLGQPIPEKNIREYCIKKGKKIRL